MNAALRAMAGLAVLAILLVGGMRLLAAKKSAGEAERQTASAPAESSADAPPDFQASASETPGAGDSAAATATTTTAAKDAGGKPAGDAAAKDVTFDDVKLELKKGDPYDSSLLTAKVKDLDGKPIRIRGYILPSFKQNDITQFVLVRDNQECCFGPGALLHDCIIVDMLPPASTSFVTRPVSVEGTFAIRELKIDGKYLAIYHLDGKAVK